MSSRERRFEATARVIRHRHSDHVHLDHRFGWDFRCLACEKGLHYWTKIKIRSCGCSKRSHGHPKVAAGLCDMQRRDRIYIWRREVRELRRLARYPGFDPETDEVWLLGNPTKESW